MSQGEEGKNNPWAWSDKTIVGLMKELELVRKIVENTSNNMELGYKIRAWANGDDPEDVDVTK